MYLRKVIVRLGCLIEVVRIMWIELTYNKYWHGCHAFFSSNNNSIFMVIYCVVLVKLNKKLVLKSIKNIVQRIFKMTNNNLKM